MNFKRYVEASDTWLDSHYIMGTSTDTITTLPADIYANDTTATVGLKGDMYQASGVSPTTPIQPSECGERTGNLFDMSFYEGKSGITVSGNKATGTCDRFFNIKLSIPPELYGQELTWSAFLKRPDNPNTVRLQTADNGSYKYGNNITGEGRSTVSFTATSTIRLYVNYANTGSDTIELSDITLNTGSTAKPFEPFGVKIPISSANTTTPVYLGEVETTRKIVKYEFTGQEAWDRQTPEHSTVINLYCPMQNAMPSSPIYCNVAKYDARAGSSNDTVVNIGKINSAGTNLLLDMTLADYNTTGVWKTYLQQQYAAGTPVTVWYVLANPETAVVNEPIRKIGGYADEVSNITIPTIAGANVVDVDTTLKPSEVTVNYKGWHPVSAVHERESGQWD